MSSYGQASALPLFAWQSTEGEGRRVGDLSRYPNQPGAKTGGTSREAAEAMSSDANGLRSAVFMSLMLDGPATADACADRLGRSILSIRPRFSELHRLGLIYATGERRANESGHRANVWAAKRGKS